VSGFLQMKKTEGIFFLGTQYISERRKEVVPGLSLFVSSAVWVGSERLRIRRGILFRKKRDYEGKCKGNIGTEMGNVQLIMVSSVL